MHHPFKPLSIAMLSAVLATSACTTNPQTGQSEISKTALYGIGGAVACGALGALGGGHDAAMRRWPAARVGAAVGGTMDYQEKKLREKLANTQIGIQRLGDQLKLTLPDNITFDTNKAEIKPQAQGPLASIGDIMAQYPDTRVTVQGFTDSTGSASRNQVLSEHRAEAVTRFLATRGVDTTRIRTMGLAPASRSHPTTRYRARAQPPGGDSDYSSILNLTKKSRTDRQNRIRACGAGVQKNWAGKSRPESTLDMGYTKIINPHSTHREICTSHTRWSTPHT